MKPRQRLAAAQGAFDVHRVRVDGTRIMARRSTLPPRHAAPTVVLMGGTSLSGRYLLPVAFELAGRFPVWVPDLPGRGASDAPKKKMPVQDHADFVAAWMSEVGIDRAALLGNSMGCQIAVETAVRHPDRVSQLMLQGPTVDAGARSLPRQFIRLVLDSRHEPASLGPLEAIDWFRAGLLHAGDQVRSMRRHRIEDRLPSVSCPALVVRGTLDPVVPRDWAAEVTQLLPEAQLREVPGAAHAVVYTHALELARVTEAFLGHAAMRRNHGTAPSTADRGV